MSLHPTDEDRAYDRGFHDGTLLFKTATEELARVRATVKQQAARIGELERELEAERERICELRQRLFGNGHLKIKTIGDITFGTSHTTACSIWGDNGQGGTAENFPEPLPCNCGALCNFEKLRAESAEQQLAERTAELEQARTQIAGLRTAAELITKECRSASMRFGITPSWAAEIAEKALAAALTGEGEGKC